HAETTL
ncbi:hypothetical protein BN1723_018650, partial [Verticillium longisporum]